MKSDHNDVEETTPTGETGVADLRDDMGPKGSGKVADAADIGSAVVQTGGAVTLDLNQDPPSSEDPYGSSPPSAKVQEITRTEEGPFYERGQGTEDPSTGGSTDPHNSLTHANSGDETE